jgi:RHS repeat-associated protein
VQEAASHDRPNPLLQAHEAPQKSYYRAKYYDPSAGRFLGQDPIGFLGGENFYIYAINNPLIWRDARGLQPNKDCPDKGCSISVSCLPTHGTWFSHCTVTTGEGSKYTAYDGMPSGSIWFSKLQIVKGPGAPPGPNTVFTQPVDCNAVRKVEAAAAQSAPGNKGNHELYSFPIQNSNTAAAYLADVAGVAPNFPWSAWGAYPY